MAIDATHVQVLKEPGRKAQDKSFMWARGSPELGIVLFDYDVSGGGQVAKNLMTGFIGALQADAHKGYDALERKYILLLGCMMHARRRFHKAWLVGGKKPGLAAQGLSFFKFIYDKEESYKAQGLSCERRKYFRDEELKPSLETFKKWVEDHLPKVPKASELGNALHYFTNEYEELTAFLADGRYEIDNGWLERTIRKFAIGRNNWMFCDTVDGAHASSILYSLVITAKLNRKDPFKVMTEIFYQLPYANTADDYEKLASLLLSPANPLSCHIKEG
jgi:transposase